jgi:hypothetical protein
MAKTGLSKTEFVREVDALLRLREHVAAALRPAADAILKFANAYRTLHQRIGPNYNRRVELRRRLGLDEYQHQRMMAIAVQSKTLGQFRRALPPAVEPLYELARLSKDAAGEKRLRAAVKRHEVTPTSGIREIRVIRKSARRASAKSASTIAPTTAQPTNFEFVVECDRVPRWTEVEQFQAELTELLTRHGLRPASGGGLKNAKTIKQSIERHWARQDGAEQSAQPTPERARQRADAELESLHSKYLELHDQHWEKVRQRAERAIRQAIRAEYNRRVRALPHLPRRKFPTKDERQQEDLRRIGLAREEVFGGVLDLADAMTIDTAADAASHLDAAHKASSEGADVSILIQVQNVGLDVANVADYVRHAKHTVPESARLQKAREAYERALAAYEQEHGAEVSAETEADDVRLREVISRAPNNRARRVWAKRSNSTFETEPSGENEPT